MVLAHCILDKFLGGSLPLLSPAFRRSHFRRQVPVRLIIIITIIIIIIIIIKMGVEFSEYIIFLTHGGMQPRASLEVQQGKTMRQIQGLGCWKSLVRLEKSQREAHPQPSVDVSLQNNCTEK